MQLSPIPKQFLDSSGLPYSGGTLEIFLAGDTKLAQVYLDGEGNELSPNPIRLDSHGSWIGFVRPDVFLDYFVKDKDGHLVFAFSNVRVYDLYIIQKRLNPSLPILIDENGNISIKEHGISRDLLKDVHNLVPDERFLKYEKFSDHVVITLSDALKTWLRNEGFNYEP